VSATVRRPFSQREGHDRSIPSDAVADGIPFFGPEPPAGRAFFLKSIVEHSVNEVVLRPKFRETYGQPPMHVARDCAAWFAADERWQDWQLLGKPPHDDVSKTQCITLLQPEVF
jgi:hypothetical protein